MYISVLFDFDLCYLFEDIKANYTTVQEFEVSDLKKKNYSFIQQVCINLIKTNIKVFYNVAKDFYFK